MPRSVNKIIADEIDTAQARIRVAELRRELAKAENRLKETKAALAQAEKEAKGGK